MSRFTFSLPDALSAFVDEQVAGRGYGASGEDLVDLIRADRDRQHLRTLLLDGAASPATAPIDEASFEDLRARVRQPQV